MPDLALHLSQKIVNDFVRKTMGCPWMAYGASSEGVDCLGLIRMYFDHIGLALPNYTYRFPLQKNLFLSHVEEHCHIIPRNNLDVGDLCIFDMGLKGGHIALFLGKGKMLHATEDVGVWIARLMEPPYRNLVRRGRVVYARVGARHD